MTKSPQIGLLQFSGSPLAGGYDHLHQRCISNEQVANRTYCAALCKLLVKQRKERPPSCLRFPVSATCLRT